MNINFKSLPTGPLTEESLKSLWSNTTNIKGIDRCQIIDIDGEKALQVTLLKGKLNATDRKSTRLNSSH